MRMRLVEAAQGGDERLLGHVVGFGLVRQDGQSQPVDGREVVVKERLRQELAVYLPLPQQSVGFDH